MDNFIKTVNEARWADGLKVRNRLDDITYNPMRSQEEFVMRLIRENAKTAYGIEHGFKNILTIDGFRRFLPKHGSKQPQISYSLRHRPYPASQCI